MGAIAARNTWNGKRDWDMDSRLLPPKDRLAVRTPLRCPVCERALEQTRIRDLGGVSADLTWELHAGLCPDHGWFQCEVISRPPREIFAVDRPFGVARRLVVNGLEVYSFSTVWNDADASVKRSRVDPFDPQYWKVRQSGAQARPANAQS